MEIIDTTITRTAEESTPCGIYSLAFTVTNGNLERVHAAVRSSKGDDKYLGNLVYENGNINASLLCRAEKKAAPLVEDFEGFIAQIRENIKSDAAGQA